jgi:hypothetical protein
MRMAGVGATPEYRLPHELMMLMPGGPKSGRAIGSRLMNVTPPKSVAWPSAEHTKSVAAASPSAAHGDRGESPRTAR